LAEALRVRPSLSVLALVGAGAFVAVGYPLVAERALDSLGPRTVGGLVLAIGLASFALTLRSRVPGLGPWLRGIPLVLPALTAATGNPRYLKLVPAAIEVTLCVVFLASLRGGGSLLQDAARILEPHAPDFIGPYCRKATAAFAALFAVQAVALAAVALAPPVRGWAVTSSLLVWVPTVAGAAFEFLLRKAWFRHYGTGPLDRLLRTLLPPENTAQGRRSLAYVRRKRRELGMPPP
jgi:uncharacterized membrane protein